MDLSNLPNYVLIPLGIFIFSIMGFSLYLIQNYIRRYREGRLKVTFIYDDRSTKTSTYSGVVDRVLFDGLEYDYNDNLTVKKKGFKYIYYVIGNKNPINFKNPKSGVMSYNDYKSIIESKVLTELLEDEDSFLSKADKILLTVIGITGIVLFITMIYLSKQPVVFSLSESYKEFIKSAVLEAIRG